MRKKIIKILPSLIVIASAASLSAYWLLNKPHVERAPLVVNVPLVEVIMPTVQQHSTTVYAMGNVIAAQSVNLTPRISGQVMQVSPNFIEGGLLKKGDELVQLDPTDYLLAIKQSENDLAKARYNLKIEQGQQKIVRREFQLLGQQLNEQEQELVLRKPHLALAQAAVAAAEANLKLAQLNLERTRPVAPFNAIITQRNANVGAWMSAFSTGTPLAKLVGTDNFWINVSVPVDKLRWLAIPAINSEQSATAKIHYEAAWGNDVYRVGVVKRLQAELEPEGRMAKLLVEVNDPLSQKAANKKLPPLMLGAYVRVDIAGKTLRDVVAIPETALHDGQCVWLLNAEQKLTIRTMQPLWTEQGKAYFAKDELANAQIITSDLATPVQGMTLRVKH